ncbi:MAG: hypothetical protein M9942_07955 [Microthrixaceae bacterium]|nr:hypothetical protein [Microthrixaceae bacterium]
MQATLRGRHTGTVISAAAVASLALQQSPANEAARAAVGFWVLDRTGSPLAVGFAVFLATVVIDGLTSALIALGLHTETGAVRRIMDWARERYGGRGDEPAPRGGPLAVDAALCLGVGAGLVVARRHFRDRHPSLGSDLLTAAGATLFVSAATGFFGFLAGGGLEYAERIGLGTPAEWIVEYGSDWRVWAVVLLVGITVSALRRRRAGRTRGTDRVASPR